MVFSAQTYNTVPGLVAPNCGFSCSSSWTPPAPTEIPPRVVLAKESAESCLRQFTKGNVSQAAPRVLSGICLPEGKPMGMICCCYSVTWLCLTLQPRGLQHTRLPCPLLSPRVCLNSCPLSQWCHQTISTSVAPFSSCPQSFPASGSSPMSPLFASGSQSIRASASASFPSREYSGLISFRIDWFDLLERSKGLSRVFSSTTVRKHQFFSTQPSLRSNSHTCTLLLEKS